MKIFYKHLLLILVTLGASSQASALVWGEGNWGDNWGVDEVREPVPPPEGPVPVAPKIKSVTGGSTDAGISAGAYADNGEPTYNDSFTSGDYITMIAEIEPDTSDVGSNGELFVILLSITADGTQWSFLNTDGNYEAWDLSLATLGAAQIKEPLEETNSITIFEGELQPGRHRGAVGYKADGGPLIYTAKAINITVGE